MAWEKREFPDGSYCEGNFVSEKLQGVGVYQFSNGDRYEGDFVNGERHGKGTYYFVDGRRCEGDFKENLLHNGTLYKPNGTTHYGIRDGKEVLRKKSLNDGYLQYRASRLVGSKGTSHFCTVVDSKPDGMKLTRDNYIDMTKTSIDGIEYTEEGCEMIAKFALENFDFNIQYFKALDKKEFDQALDSFLSKHPQFEEVLDLDEYEEIPGYYIMVLDEYCQAYVGTSRDIKKRIKGHWTKTMPLDRLIFGRVDASILSIDSFRAYDTTRIFAYVTADLYSIEDDFLNDFPDKFLSNRTKGGAMPLGLLEATIHMRNRELR